MQSQLLISFLNKEISVLLKHHNMNTYEGVEV